MLLRNLILFPPGGVRYLLRDEFNDTRAAGAVNGTPATPGPGTRTVIDTLNNLRVIGGMAEFNHAAGISWNNPYLRYEAQTRTAGRILLCERTNADMTQGRGFGFRTNPAPGLGVMVDIETMLYERDDVSYFHDGTASIIPVGVPVDATTYRGAHVLRSTGSYALIKGGAFTNWTLLWISLVKNTAILYPFYTTRDDVSIDNVDYLRIPDVLWLPTPAAYDTFTRANGPLGTSEATGPDGQATPTRAWTDEVGTWAIAGNVATCSALAGGIGIATVDTGVASVLTSATLTRAGNEVGTVLRYVDSDNYIRAVHDGVTGCQLIKRVAAVETTVITAAVPLGAGDIRVTCDGTTFRLYLNDAQVGATSTIADAALQTGTKQGLFTTNVGNTMDALSVFPRGLGGEYSMLDRW